MPSRRAFLATLSAALAGQMVDPDFLKWEPGARAFFDMGAADPRLSVILHRGDMVSFAGVDVVNPVTGRVIAGVPQTFVITGDVVEPRRSQALPVWPTIYGPQTAGRLSASASGWSR